MDSLARLNVRPHEPQLLYSPGLSWLGSGSQRDGLLLVPGTASDSMAMPLMISLHGSGGDAEGGLSLFRDQAQEFGFAVVAPESREYTWDVIAQRRFGPDVAFLERALDIVFDRVHIDPTRIAMGGFSDGASYALSLGITNGDLFSHIVAFSPGFAVPEMRRDSPRIFLSHGTHDQVLPIDRCSRVIRRKMIEAGLPLTYREFDGPHTVPVTIANDAAAWFLEGRNTSALPGRAASGTN